MKISVIQTRPAKGNIEKNIENHSQLIGLAISHGAEAIFFPELSLTGYEPGLSKELATDRNDPRFNIFQKISDISQITIGVGVPLKSQAGICISMVLFQPKQTRKVYLKTYLHPDEEGFFTSGQNSTNLIGGNTRIALAICYELSVPEHSESAFRSGAEVYIAAVAKSAGGIEKAIETLSHISNKYSFAVLVSNCVGRCDNFESGGKTSIWNNKGTLCGQLDDKSEGILVFDTDTQEVTQVVI